MKVNRLARTVRNEQRIVMVNVQNIKNGSKRVWKYHPREDIEGNIKNMTTEKEKTIWEIVAIIRNFMKRPTSTLNDDIYDSAIAIYEQYIEVNNE